MPRSHAADRSARSNLLRAIKAGRISATREAQRTRRRRKTALRLFAAIGGVGLFTVSMLRLAHADTLTVQYGYDTNYVWTNVPISYGLRQTYFFDAGLGTYLNPNAEGETRGFWLNDTSGAPMHVVITDGDIGTAGYSYFQFPTSGMYQGEINGLQWNEQILVNNIPILSPDQIIDVHNEPYSISAVFDITSIGTISGGSGFSQFIVAPLPTIPPVSSVPGPIVGAGAPGLLAFLMFLLARHRRRRN